MKAAENGTYTLRSVAANKQARTSEILPKRNARENLERLSPSFGVLKNTDFPEAAGT